VGVNKKLLATIVETLEVIARKDPSWTLFLGKETFSAPQLLEKLRKDKKFAEEVENTSVALAIEMWNEGRRKLESNSSTPPV
jgi:hypothetical protein